MVLVAVFLGILILALLVGHGFLAITGQKKGKQGEKAVEKQLIEISPETKKLLMPSETLSKQDASMLKERIDKLEKLLLSAQQKLVVQNLGQEESRDLFKKLQNLTDFKHEIRIEVAALKEEVKAIKQAVGIKEEPRAEIEISQEKLHDLIYNVRK